METQLSFIGKDPHGSPFDSIKHVDENGEYWLARELQGPLGYIEWRKFQQAIERAQIACKNSGYDVRDHFGGAAKMIDLAKGAQREVYDVRLSRYACYLVAMNGDPRKSEISEAQTYFAIKTHIQEIHEAEPVSPTIAALEAAVLVLKEHDRRLADLEAWRQECQSTEVELLSLPASTVNAPETPIRAATRKIVNATAHRRGVPQSFVWSGLYRDAKYRLGFDPVTRAKHSGNSALDEVEAAGKLPELYAIAREVLQ